MKNLFRNLRWLWHNSLCDPPDERNFFVIDWKKVEEGRESILRATDSCSEDAVSEIEEFKERERQRERREFLRGVISFIQDMTPEELAKCQSELKKKQGEVA